jgi:hypothetical protein
MNGAKVSAELLEKARTNKNIVLTELESRCEAFNEEMEIDPDHIVPIHTEARDWFARSFENVVMSMRGSHMSSNGKSSIDFSSPLMLCDGLCGCRATFEYGKENHPRLSRRSQHR